jgi:transcription elongation factor Elf1
MLEPITLNCPYCGENFSTSADLSAGSQRYVEDCAVCCRPIEITVRVDEDGELLGIDATTDRD